MLPTALVGVGAILAYTTMRGPKNLVDLRSSLDGRVYRVQNLPDKQSACDMMSRIRKNLVSIVERFRDDPNYVQDEPYQRLVTRFNPDVLEENDMDADCTSYSENKGEKIVVCLRDKTKAPTYPLVEDNTVMFVLIHELAHLMTASTGHTPEFWTNFRKLLQDCVQLGVYTPVNYARFPTPYCGMTITDTPLTS
jgi:hypothetical protein